MPTTYGRDDSTARFSVAQYQRMIDQGILTPLLLRAAPPGWTVSVQLTVSAELVYVHVDGSTWTKLPLPAAAREMLETGALGKVTDHAGWTTGSG